MNSRKAIDFVTQKSNKSNTLGKSFSSPSLESNKKSKKTIFISTDSSDSSDFSSSSHPTISRPTESTSRPAKSITISRPAESTSKPTKSISISRPAESTSNPTKSPSRSISIKRPLRGAKTPQKPIRTPVAPMQKPSVSISHKITRSGSVSMAKHSATRLTHVDTPVMKLPSPSLHISYSDPLYDKKQSELHKPHSSPLKSFRNSHSLLRPRQDTSKSKPLKKEPKSPFLTSVVVEKRPLGDDIPVKNIYEPKLPTKSEPPKPPIQSKIVKETNKKPKKLVKKQAKSSKISPDTSSEPNLSVGVIIFLTVLVGIATAIAVYFLLSK